MTMTAETPTAATDTGSVGPHPAGSGRSKPSLRFAARIARRELKLRRGRAALVIALVALPTCIMLSAAAYVRTTNEANAGGQLDYASDLVVPFVVSGASGELGSPDPVPAESRPAVTASEVEAVLPAGSTVQPVVSGYTSIMAEDGQIFGAEFAHVDLSTAAAAPWAPLSEGRAAEAGEVVLGGELAANLGVDVGDTLTLRQPAGQWTVAGIARWNYSLLAVPDFDDSQLVLANGELLVNLPSDFQAADVDQLSEELGAWVPQQSRFSPPIASYEYGSDGVAVTWVAAMMLFVMFGVIIVAAFATIARGQLVTVGQLAANGATNRFTRRVLALQGFWSGLVGVAIGGGAALAVLLILRRPILMSFAVPVSHIAWSPVDVIVIALIGVAVSTGAAALPAVSLVKTSVLDALAGRRADRPVPVWMVPIGVVGFALGLLLLVISTASEGDSAVAGAMVGVLAMAVGVCLIGPLVIDLASRTAHVMPLSIRISLRGLGRARLRSAAVASSIAVTTGVMAVIIGGFQADTQGPNPGETAENMALVVEMPSLEIRTPDGDALLDEYGVPLSDRVADAETVALRWIVADAMIQLAEARRVLPDATERPLRVAVRPDGVYDNTVIPFVVPADESEFSGWSPGYGPPPGIGAVEEIGNLPVIADDSTLSAFSLPESFRRELDTVGTAFAVGRPCSGALTDLDSPPVQASSDAASGFEPIVSAQIPVRGLWCSGFVGPFMTEQFAVDHGFQIEPAGAVLVNPEPLTDDERDRLVGDSFTRPSIFAGWDFAGYETAIAPTAPSSVLAFSFSALRPGVTVYYPTTNADDFALLQGVLFVAALLFVTLIIGIGLALAAADSRRDRAVLSVVGAKPATLRRVAATDAWVLAMIGTTLGVPAGLFAAWVVTSSTGDQRPTGVPWLFVGLEFVVVPLVVAGLVYLAGMFRRSGPPMDVLAVD